jgi:hypothetical protein
MAKRKNEWEEFLIVRTDDLDPNTLESPAWVALHPPTFPDFDVPVPDTRIEAGADPAGTD